jgi:hypothetical protein
MRWWVIDRGQPRQGKRQGQAERKSAPDPPSLEGNDVPAKTARANPKRKISESNATSTHASATLSMITDNLINVGSVMAVSGTVLLGLLAIKHF